MGAVQQRKVKNRIIIIIMVRRRFCSSIVHLNRKIRLLKFNSGRFFRLFFFINLLIWGMHGRVRARENSARVQPPWTLNSGTQNIRHPGAIFSIRLSLERFFLLLLVLLNSELKFNDNSIIYRLLVCIGTHWIKINGRLRCISQQTCGTGYDAAPAHPSQKPEEKLS